MNMHKPCEATYCGLPHDDNGAHITTGPYEYRVVTKDAGEPADPGLPMDTEYEAQEQVKAILANADPPFADVWIERRSRATWERVPVSLDDGVRRSLADIDARSRAGMDAQS
jgi:hypothetical protein